MRLRNVFAIVSLAFLIACADPNPQPTPEPTPQPSPTPVPWEPPSICPRTVVNNNQWTRDGKVVCPLGAINCDEFAEWSIYPPVIVQEMMNHGARFTHIRLGPFWTPLPVATAFKCWPDIPRPFEPLWSALSGVNSVDIRTYDSAYAIEDGKANLNTWAPDYDENGNILFWGRVDRLLKYATNSNKFFLIEIDVFDGWIAQRPELSPLARANNIQGENWIHGEMMLSAPGQRILDYIDYVIYRTGWANVSYQVGNETFPKENLGWKGSSVDWEFAVRNKIRNSCKKYGYPVRMVSTNSHDETIEAGFDYVNRHTKHAKRDVNVNEFNDAEVSPEEWREEAWQAKAYGTLFHLWRCNWTDEEYRRALTYLNEINQ